MLTLQFRLAAEQARRRVLFGASIAMIAAAVIGPGASPANADHNNPVAICGGSEYGGASLGVDILGPDGGKIGRLSIHGHVNSDTFCAVTERRFHNQSKQTVARIKRCASGTWPLDPCNGDVGWWDSDAGQYLEYAGPVYREKNGGTIVARGEIGGRCAMIFFINAQGHATTFC
jgi:hypothetical protein